jgi:hypothetical protein
MTRSGCGSKPFLLAGRYPLERGRADGRLRERARIGGRSPRCGSIPFDARRTVRALATVAAAAAVVVARKPVKPRQEFANVAQK